MADTSKLKNKPRPPPSPASKREDPTEQKDLPDQMPPSEQPDSNEKEPPSEKEPNPEQTESPSEKKDPATKPELKPETKDLPVDQTKLKPETKDLPTGTPEPAPEQQDPPKQQPANTLSSPPSAPTSNLPTGGRKGKDEGDLASKAGEVAAGAVPNAGFELPGAPQLEEDKSSLKIKIHLNIRAKVRLELDAQIYGDVVIGLL